MNWQTVPTIQPFKPNEVHIYLIDLNDYVGDIALLTAKEQQRVRQGIEKVRRQFIATRSFLRTLLNYQADFIEGEFGKLFIPDNPLHFNLAHSNELAIFAVDINRPIGIDIEYHRPLSNMNDIAERVFNNDELEHLYLSDSEQFERFYQLWTRKEATVKYSGLGITTDLKKVSCENNCELLELPIAANYSGSLCKSKMKTVVLYSLAFSNKG